MVCFGFSLRRNWKFNPNQIILDLIKLDSTEPTKMLQPIIGIVFSVKLQITCIDFTLLASWSFSLENYPFDLEAFNCILLFMFIYYFDFSLLKVQTCHHVMSFFIYLLSNKMPPCNELGYIIISNKNLSMTKMVIVQALHFWQVMLYISLIC